MSLNELSQGLWKEVDEERWIEVRMENCIGLPSVVSMEEEILLDGYYHMISQ